MKRACCLLISVIVFCSCKKSNGDNPPAPKSNETVYISGTCWDSLKGRNVPVYWEDSTVHYLSGAVGANSYAQAIAWSNNELLVAGLASLWTPAAGLWVNGIPKDLGLGSTALMSDIFGIYASGNDIYLAGFGVNEYADYGQNNYAKVWKNGTITTLNNSPGYSQAVGVTVVGQDLYVAWTQGKTNGHSMAVYNKNENRFILDSVSYNAECQAICSAGADVYISGNLTDTVSKKALGVYWKNGSLIHLTSIHEENTFASGIVAAGDDVYVSGMEGYSYPGYAAYWKNGIEHRITDGTFSAVAYAIAVSGPDIYTAGMDNNLPMYWKNDVPHKLPLDKTHSRAFVSGMVVVKR